MESAERLAVQQQARRRVGASILRRCPCGGIVCCNGLFDSAYLQLVNDFASDAQVATLARVQLGTSTSYEPEQSNEVHRQEFRIAEKQHLWLLVEAVHSCTAVPPEGRSGLPTRAHPQVAGLPPLAHA
jgi:hypothetical protein